MSEHGGGRLRALLVEDEWLARNYLVELLQATGRVEIVAAVATLAEAKQALALDAPVAVDAAFVDVHLAGRHENLAGLDWVREISGLPGAPRFVLATAFPQHAVTAFDIGVVDYLLKPFTLDRVSECVRRLFTRGIAPARPALARMVARRQRALVFLELDEVWACEASERLTRVHSRRGLFELDLTLSAIEPSFGGILARVHRNWLVNAARVLELERATGETVLVVGEPRLSDGACLRVPVARDRAQAVRELLMQNSVGVRR